MYCLVIGGNYLPITARPSESGGEEEGEEERRAWNGKRKVMRLRRKMKGKLG